MKEILEKLLRDYLLAISIVKDSNPGDKLAPKLKKLRVCSGLCSSFACELEARGIEPPTSHNLTFEFDGYMDEYMESITGSSLGYLGGIKPAKILFLKPVGYKTKLIAALQLRVDFLNTTLKEFYPGPPIEPLIP